MDEERKEYMFGFGVYPITLAEAGELFDKIIDLVEAMDGVYMGGGYGEYGETDEEAKEQTGNTQVWSEARRGDH